MKIGLCYSDDFGRDYSRAFINKVWMRFTTFLSEGILVVRSVFRNLSKDMEQALFSSRCMLLISVGQEAHEGERLQSTIQLVNRFFSHCTVLLYDSLQRYTISLNSKMDPDHFHLSANRAGEDWLLRNESCINDLSMPFSISRWDYWLSHPGYMEALKVLKKRVKEDIAYQLAFEDTIEQYLLRYKKRLVEENELDDIRARTICFDYLLEECAVLCLWTELNCQFEIYPNAHNQAMEATRHRFISPFYPNLLRSLSLRFRDAKQLRPQMFNLAEEDCILA